MLLFVLTLDCEDNFPFCVSAECELGLSAGFRGVRGGRPSLFPKNSTFFNVEFTSQSR